MGYGVEIQASGAQSFAQAVLEASHHRPILVDFFATWCGPCQMLKPLLERLGAEYDLALAKVDIDQHPQLASQYHVDGVPDVRVALGGQLRPGFVGMLPEPKLREFLQGLGLQSQMEQELAQAQALVNAGRFAEAKAQFDRLFTQYPRSGAVAVAAGEFLIRAQKPQEARQILNTLEPDDRPAYDRAQNLKGLLGWQELSQSPEGNPDLDGAFAQAIQGAIAGDYGSALESLLAIVSRDRKYRQDGARKAMLTLFEVLGADHPLTPTYRKRLIQSLY
jgi:putative thioredoxin